MDIRENLKEGDVLVFASGRKKIYNINDNVILRQFYNENLECPSNTGYTVVEILRPEYKNIWGKQKVLKK